MADRERARTHDDGFASDGEADVEMPDASQADSEAMDLDEDDAEFERDLLAAMELSEDEEDDDLERRLRAALADVDEDDEDVDELKLLVDTVLAELSGSSDEDDGVAGPA